MTGRAMGVRRGLGRRTITVVVVLVTACATVTTAVAGSLGSSVEGRFVGGSALQQASVVDTPTQVVRAPQVSRRALAFGVTHNEVSADAWHGAAAVRRPWRILRDIAQYQNQHLMGWGALNPEPSPGRYEWDTLDARLDLIATTGGEPVLTLCCAPDWMKGGEPGTTDWSELETAPAPEHFADFAALAARAAARYPDVRYFLVWNELKGFYLEDEERWDVESYTELYNMVYTAVKQVRPDALVGGPYIGMDSWAPGVGASHPSAVTGPWGQLDQRPLDVLEYWFANAVGADFVAIDGHLSGYGGVAASPLTALGKFAAANRWIAARTDLPIWWVEFYLDHPGVTRQRQEANLVIRLLNRLERSGAAVALLWDPNGTGERRCGDCLWADVGAEWAGSRRPLPTLLRAWRAEAPLAAE